MKYLVILYSVFYLLLSTNITVNFHFCCDRVQSVSLFGKPAKSCCAGKENRKGCCHDETRCIKLKEHPCFSDQVFPFFEPVAVLENELYFPVESSIGYFPEHPVFHYPKPPPKPKTPIYLKNRVLRI